MTARHLDDGTRPRSIRGEYEAFIRDRARRSWERRVAGTASGVRVCETDDSASVVRAPFLAAGIPGHEVEAWMRVVQVSLVPLLGFDVVRVVRRAAAYRQVGFTADQAESWLVTSDAPDSWVTSHPRPEPSRARALHYRGWDGYCYAAALLPSVAAPVHAAPAHAAPAHAGPVHAGLAPGAALGFDLRAQIAHDAALRAWLTRDLPCTVALGYLWAGVRLAEVDSIWEPLRAADHPQWESAVLTLIGLRSDS